jgi:hypothetical protein
MYVYIKVRPTAADSVVNASPPLAARAALG